MAYQNAGLNPYQQGFYDRSVGFNGGPATIYAPTSIQINWGGFGGFGNMNGYSSRPAYPPPPPRPSFDFGSILPMLQQWLSQQNQPPPVQYVQHMQYVNTPAINMTPPPIQHVYTPPINMTPPRAVAVPLPPPINMTPPRAVAVPLPPPINMTPPVAVAVPVTQPIPNPGEPPGPANESISVDYLAILQEAMDANHDGRLTLSEFNPNMSREQLKQASLAALNFKHHTTGFTTLSEDWVNSLVEGKNFVNAHQDVFFRPTPMGAMLTPEMQEQRRLNAGFTRDDIEQFAHWDGEIYEVSATQDLPQQQAFWNSQPPPP